MSDRPTRMPRSVRAALTILLPLASVGLVLVLFEMGLRLTGHRAIYEMYSKPSLFWIYDELLGWSHQPGARGEFVGPRPWPVEFHANVSINSIGLRGPEVPPRDPAELRVLFTGDSMIAGLEVENDQTFVALLAPLLRERLGVPVRMINAGVRGYGTDQSYLYFRERGWRLEPDLVVFFHTSNDPADNTTLHEMRRPFGKPAFSLGPDGKLSLVGAPVPRYPSCSEVLLTSDFQARRVDGLAGRLLCNAQMLLFDHSALFSYATLSIPWNYELLKGLFYVGNPHGEHLKADSSDRLEWRLTNAILLAYAREVDRRGAAFLLIGYRSHLAQLDQAAIAAAGIASFPLTQIEIDLPKLSWHHDSHFNPEGHRLVAETLAPELAPLLAPRAAAIRAATQGG